MPAQQVTFDQIFGEGLSLARQHARLLVPTGAAIAVGYTVLDMVGASGAVFAVNLVVSIMIQYLVLEQLLADRILPEARGKRSYGAMFGSGLLSGLGTMLGLIALVLPGIYVASRWLSSSAFVVAEGSSSVDALSNSWAASEASVGAHVVATLIASLPLLAVLGVAFLTGFAGSEVPTLVNSIAVNALSAVSSLAMWVVGAAAYRVTRPHNAGLEGVFA